MRGLLSWAALLPLSMSLASPALADVTVSGPSSEIETWVDAHRAPTDCADHCFVLDRLALRGDVQKSELHFELSGRLLGSGPYLIPIVGPPGTVRLGNVRVGGKAAALTFDADHWVVQTSDKSFVITGTLTLGDAAELHVPGPVNVIDADLAHGRIVEGDHLSGVTSAVLHVEAGESARPQAETFDLSRAVRVGDRVTFEYVLKMSAGHDLGVQKLPLRNGEQVTSVDGAGWTVEDGELVLRMSGHTAGVTIRGVLPGLGDFTADPRSASEWVLVESDLDHEVKVEGDATPADVAESPIRATAPTSRAYRLMPKERLGLHAERRTSHDVLAAVVDSHARSVVLTAAGDLVMSDTLNYDNSSLDVMLLHAHARPIFLAVDGVPERILHEGDPAKTDEVAVPLRAGHHTARLQSLAQERIGWFAGALRIPMPDQPVTTSEITATVGLPEHVHPVVTTGGDRSEWLVASFRDLAAIVSSILVSLIAFRRRRARVVGSLVGFGLWLVAPAAFVVGLGLGAAALGVRWAGAHLTGMSRRLAYLGCIGLVGALAFAALHSAGALREEGGQLGEDSRVAGVNLPMAQSTVRMGAEQERGGAAADQATAPVANFGMIGLLDTGSTQKGVTPVELPMPSAARAVTIRRELVTRDRPFSPVVYYVTDALLHALTGLWLLGIVTLAWMYRLELVRLRDRVRELFAPRPQPVGER